MEEVFRKRKKLKEKRKRKPIRRESKTPGEIRVSKILPFEWEMSKIENFSLKDISYSY